MSENCYNQHRHQSEPAVSCASNPCFSPPNDDDDGGLLPVEMTAGNVAVANAAEAAELGDEEKELRSSLIRAVLPDCQPQEGSPANTFTDHELHELQAAILPQMMMKNKYAKMNVGGGGGCCGSAAGAVDVPDGGGGGGIMMNIMTDPWEAPKEAVRAAVVEAAEAAAASSSSSTATSPANAAVVDADDVVEEDAAAAALRSSGDTVIGADAFFFDDAQPQDGASTSSSSPSCPQEAPAFLHEEKVPPPPVSLHWHGAPRFPQNVHQPREFRELVRSGDFASPTNSVCPGFLQCNLVVLPKSSAFDFLLFCQRNPKACPLIEVCDAGSPVPVGVAPGADLRYDVPKYCVYRNGKLEREVTDIAEYWTDDLVAFLVGCSFSYDGALMDAGIPLRSAEAGQNVPMYRTSLPCRPAGKLRGNMVVSMKPIPCTQVAKHIEITSKYTHAHGGPVCVGMPDQIGIDSACLHEPQWGDGVEMEPGDVPVFHACGVTPQAVLMESEVPFAITHSAGHMFVTDLPSDMGV